MKTTTCLIGLLSAATVAAGSPVRAQSYAAHPLLRDGEVLRYEVASARFGAVGSATLQVGLDSLNDRSAYRISLEFSVRLPGYFVTTQADSWVDTETLSTLYMSRCVQSSAGERTELVDIAAVLNTWSDSTGAHPLDSPEPLDELAMIYLLRGLPASDALEPLLLSRHFDAARNPVRVRRLGVAAVQALNGTHPATILELNVKQPGAQPRPVVVYLSRDAARLPLRIELALPGAGALSFILQSASDTRRIALADPSR